MQGSRELNWRAIQLRAPVRASDRRRIHLPPNQQQDAGTMEPAAPPAANQATTASADFFVVPPVRQTYATGDGARAVPKMGRRRKIVDQVRARLLLQRPAARPRTALYTAPPTPTDVSFLISPVRQRAGRPF